MRGRKGVCACGHEVKKWHVDGVCTYGEGLQGEARGLNGNVCTSCPGHKKKREAAMQTKHTRSVTIRHDVVDDALSNIIIGFQVIRAELARIKTHADTRDHAEVKHVDARRENGAGTRGRVPEILNGSSADVAHRSYVGEPSESGHSRLHRALLTVLAQNPEGLAKSRALLLAGYRSSGDVSKAWAALRSDGFIDGDSVALHITEEGLRVLGPFTPLPKGDELRRQVLESSKLKPVERALLGVICDAYPSPIAKGEALDRANYASSGDTSKAFARLVRFGYAMKSERGTLRASGDLF